MILTKLPNIASIALHSFSALRVKLDYTTVIAIKWSAILLIIVALQHGKACYINYISGHFHEIVAVINTTV